MVVAAVLGVVVAAALWWLYFDVVALVAERRLRSAAPGRERNAIGARLLLVPAPPDGRRASCCVALGLKKTLGHVEDPLKLVPAVAMLGGVAMYLLAHVAFRWRNVRTLQQPAAACARWCWLALIPLAVELPALAMLGDPGRGARRADRLRDAALRRAARPHPPPAGPRSRGRLSR